MEEARELGAKHEALAAAHAALQAAAAKHEAEHKKAMSAAAAAHKRELDKAGGDAEKRRLESQVRAVAANWKPLPPLRL